MSSYGQPWIFRKSPVLPWAIPPFRARTPRRNFRLFLAGAVALWALPAVGQGSEAPPHSEQSDAAPAPSPSDFAGVFDDSYHPAPRDLTLDAEGAERAKSFAHYFKALGHEARGNSAAAIVEYEKLLTLNPGNPRIARHAAELVRGAGAGIEGGKKFLEAALNAAPGDPAARLHLSAYLAAHGDAKDRAYAVALAKEAVEKFPASPEALEHYVGISVAARQGSTAAILIKKLAVSKKHTARFWLALARSANLIWPQKRGDATPLTPGARIVRARADGFFALALELDPTEPTIAREAAEYFERTGRLANAVKVYETLLAGRKDLLSDRLTLALYYRRLDRDGEAIRELEALAEIDPREPVLRTDLAELYEEAGEITKAIPHAEQALRLMGGSRTAHLRLCRLFQAAGQNERWLEHARRTFEIFPKSPNAGFSYGHALHTAGRNGEAAAILEKCIILCQAYDRRRLDAEFYLIYGLALSRDGQLEKAERTLTKGLTAIPKASPVSETVPLLTALADTLHQAGKHEDALKNLRRAHAAAPDDPELNRKLRDWKSKP